MVAIFYLYFFHTVLFFFTLPSFVPYLPDVPCRRRFIVNVLSILYCQSNGASTIIRILVYGSYTAADALQHRPRTYTGQVDRATRRVFRKPECHFSSGPLAIRFFPSSPAPSATIRHCNTIHDDFHSFGRINTTTIILLLRNLFTYL